MCPESTCCHNKATLDASHAHLLSVQPFIQLFVHSQHLSISDAVSVCIVKAGTKFRVLIKPTLSSALYLFVSA